MNELPLFLNRSDLATLLDGADTLTITRSKSKGSPLNDLHPGDRLWVRETWLATRSKVIYRADLIEHDAAVYGAMYGGWKRTKDMPRSASRIALEVVGVMFNAENMDVLTLQLRRVPQSTVDGKASPA